MPDLWDELLHAANTKRKFTDEVVNRAEDVVKTGFDLAKFLAEWGPTLIVAGLGLYALNTVKGLRS